MADVPLKATVQSQMVTAMKSGDKLRTQVLRMLLSEIKRKEADDVNANPQEAVSAYAKTLRKSMAEMQQHGRTDLASAIQAELVIVDEFLPKLMDDAALATLVEQTMSGLGPITKKEQGKAIGAVMKAVAGAGASADAGKVRALVESKITG